MNDDELRAALKKLDRRTLNQVYTLIKQCGWFRVAAIIGHDGSKR